MGGGSQERGERFGGAAQSWAHHADLVMYARRVLGDRSDTAEDIVQEAYLRLLGLAASDEAPTSARPWLFRVVRNLAIDERRSVARRADPVAEPAILGTAAIDDTAALVEQREELNEAFRDIAALPPRERRALEMDQAGMGAQAIATELGTTPNAVHQALFRARRRMRNARAVAWGLIPIGIAPIALRLSDPALAMTITNLPPGAPVGRALPVAGLVAAAIVGGSVVAPTVDHSPADPGATRGFVMPAAASSSSAQSPATPSPARTVGTARSKSSGSGSTDSGKSDDSGDDGSGSNRGRDDRGDRSGSNRGSDDGDSHRGSGSGSSSDNVDDKSDSESGRRSGRHKSGSGSTTVSGTTTNSDDTPDEPDAPDDTSGK